MRIPILRNHAKMKEQDERNSTLHDQAKAQAAPGSGIFCSGALERVDASPCPDHVDLVCVRCQTGAGRAKPIRGAEDGRLVPRHAEHTRVAS